jgi:hypothetical protein
MGQLARHLSFARVFGAACLIALLWGWYWRAPLRELITPESGLGYALGIVGGSLMLSLVIYPLRKRIEAMRFVGSIPFWFKTHMLFGVVGPILVLYHCDYSLGATNSNVALYCMLLVSGSGLIGRYVYSRVYDEMLGRQVTIAEVRQAADKICEQSTEGGVLPGLLKEVHRLETWVVRPAKGLLGQMLRPLVVGTRAVLARHKIRQVVESGVAELAQNSRPIAAQRDRLVESLQRYSLARIEALRRVSEFQYYARMFSWWHVFHFPLFFMLLVAGIVHVIAVNVY